MPDRTHNGAPLLEGYPVGTPEFCANPYPTWALLRKQGPVLWWADAGVFVVVTFDEARDVLSDATRFSPSRLFAAGSPGAADPSSHRGLLERNGLFHLAPEDHLRVRRLINPAFSPASVTALRSRIDALVAEHLDGVDRLDVTPPATLLPLQVMGAYLGLDDDVTAWLCSHTASIATLSNPLADAGDAARLEGDLAELDAGLTEEFAARRTTPRDDLLTQLVSAVDDEGRLTDGELFALVVALLMAGAETTSNLLTLGTLALAEHPDIAAELAADRAKLPAAIEEMARWSYIGFAVARYAIGDTDVAGVHVPAGALLIISIGSALRDPAVVDDPDRFDIGRVQPPALSFGVGVRHCLGAALARTTAHSWFDQLLTGGVPELDGEPRFRTHLVLRGLEHLPVRLTQPS